MNPFSVPMMDAYHAYRVLHGYDIACADYIAYAQTAPTLSTASVTTSPTSPPPVTGATKTNDGTQSLHQCIVKGLKAAAGAAAEKLVQTMAPTEVIDREMIPALTRWGWHLKKNGRFCRNCCFLPKPRPKRLPSSKPICPKTADKTRAK